MTRPLCRDCEHVRLWAPPLTQPLHLRQRFAKCRVSPGNVKGLRFMFATHSRLIGPCGDAGTLFAPRLGWIERLLRFFRRGK